MLTAFDAFCRIGSAVAAAGELSKAKGAIRARFDLLGSKLRDN
jgi:hypothetical protein